MGVEVVLYGVFAGAGYTTVPTAISSSLNLARIPLAFLVTLTWGFGLSGLAWMITTTCFLRAILLVALLRNRKWLRASL